jgi:4-amino-4-deoxy-L-arabinose transferase-like glycosyltransferase
MSAVASSRRAASKPDAAAAEARPRLAPRDFAIVGAILLLALFMMARTGSRRGVELMPWPDGLEYAAEAINLNHGLGPVLHFGSYSYPPRYTEGYPLMLAAARVFIPDGVDHLYLATAAMGLGAIALLFCLACIVFDRPSAIIAALLLALSPLFVTYSMLVLSDVPTMLVTIVAALALAAATGAERGAASRRAMIAWWAMFGLLAGFTVLIRPTNATILGGVVLCLAMVPPAGAAMGPRATLLALGAFAVAFAIAPLWQLHLNAQYLGGAFRSGYAWWVPELYGSISRTFNPDYLFGPTLPRNPHGNAPVYLATLAGVDGILGDPGDLYYFVYPFAAAAFAVVGIAAAIREPGRRVVRRLVWFGVGFLGALLAVYLVYVFTEVAFLLPAMFIVFIAAGYGAVRSNRWLRDVIALRRRTPRMLAGAAAVVALDLMLVLGVTVETATRLNFAPQPSDAVPALESVQAHIASDATVVSNISLQFLELYLPGAGRRLVGLNTYDPGQRFTDYHLHRLFVKRSKGWTDPVPPVLFDERGTISNTTATALAAAAGTKAGAYLLLAAPESRDYAGMLHDEMAQLATKFTLAPVMQSRDLALYRLSPR